MKKIESIRREYGKTELLEKNMSPDPISQFDIWLKEVLEEKLLDPTAMVLATVDERGFPDTRVVLLKGFDHNGFVFFTDYQSPKAIQAEKNGTVALNFHWREFARQVRIRGQIKRISRHESEMYFSSRPRESQISAVTSNQSAIIASRSELEKHVTEVAKQYHEKNIPCPDNWGGYSVIPFEFEFFQGRDDRLNDRIRYLKLNNHWKMERLSP